MSSNEFQQRFHFFLFLFFLASEATLLKLCSPYIPDRDFIACELCSVYLLSILKNKQPQKYANINYPKDFSFHAAVLSLAEVIFTIILPWLMIIKEHKPQGINEAGYLLGSHLFIFQAQIIFELFILMSGKQNRWIVFPYTCAANAYRLIPIITSTVHGMGMLQDGPPLELTEWIDIFLLPCFTVTLWLYSSFHFIPKVWYPLIHPQQQEI